MGSPDSVEERGYDERPHAVRVDPFFLSKYELTQDQWKRWTADMPAEYPPGTERVGVRSTELHPIESVSWIECNRVASLLGLALPTEEQWEYACRAGSEVRYGFGDSGEALENRENVADDAFRTLWSNRGLGPKAFAAWNDGFALHAPVGSFEPNRFGLHDMHGNVSEWTASRYDPNYGLAEGDPGFIPVEPAKKLNRVARGGNYYWDPSNARAATRQPLRPGNLNQTIGVRYSRPLDR
jgi:formylglycine-generating enzyme required for sulfatase activity